MLVRFGSAILAVLNYLSKKIFSYYLKKAPLFKTKKRFTYLILVISTLRIRTTIYGD